MPSTFSQFHDRDADCDASAQVDHALQPVSSVANRLKLRSPIFATAANRQSKTIDTEIHQQELQPPNARAKLGAPFRFTKLYRHVS